MGERFAAYLTADSKRWKIITPAAVLSDSSNIFYTVEIENLVTLDSQFVGPVFTDNDITGEQSITNNGKIMALSSLGEEFVNIYGLDRCSGQLTFIEQLVNSGEVYGLEFSPNNKYLYVQYSGQDSSGVTQYDLQANNIGSSGISVFSVNVKRGINQMQLSPKGQILIVDGLDMTSLDMIPYPDLRAPACGYINDTIVLAMNTNSRASLPHMPNYNMPPSGVFAAQAGNGDTLCASIGSVTLGVAQQPHILYQWQANPTLSSTTIAQPIASPTQNTWYYLTVTDTTSVSCAVNTDSVFVKVENCVGIDEPEKLVIRVYPNPASSAVTLILPEGLRWPATFELYNLTGQQLMSQPITQSNMQLSLDLPEGIYIYKILVNNELKTTDKLVIVE